MDNDNVNKNVTQFIYLFVISIENVNYIPFFFFFFI